MVHVKGSAVGCGGGGAVVKWCDGDESKEGVGAAEKSKVWLKNW